MSKKSKLLAALDAHKGRDYEAEKRAKQAKAAEKRKKEKNESTDVGIGPSADHDQDMSSAKDNRSPAEQNRQQAAPPDDSFAVLSDHERENMVPKKDKALSRATLSKAKPEFEVDIEANSDVPLSDLSSEDLADTIPHQRLTINNTTALLASTKRISVVHHPKMKFSAHNSLILTSLPPTSASIPDPNDDLTRELEFYRICRTAAVEARKTLKKDKVPFTRPSDYFAEMVKTDEQMGRVKKKMYDEAVNKKAAAEARKVRDAKKFGKAVQMAKEQERAKEKKQVLEKISSLKRKRKGQDTGTVTEGDDLFENIHIDNTTTTNPRGKASDHHKASSSSTRNPEGDNNNNKLFKRQKRDQKFGFGGKKRFAKSGDAVSTADMRAFPGRKMKAGGGGGGGGARKEMGKGKEKKRLGKNRRAATASAAAR